MDETAGDLTATPKRLDVLGVPVDAVNMTTALKRVREMLARRGNGVILAVNPEKVMAARRDPLLLRVLRSADLLLPDGIGVVMAARLAGHKAIARVPGSELMPEVCRVAATGGHTVFLYGARPEVVTRAATMLRHRYSGLRIVGEQHGYLPEEEMEDLVARINASGADILFVALGSPRQELWLERYAHRLDVRVCQGVGGTFDAICGNVRRAPLLFRKLNLEWFYRLLSQPQRAGRQKALPKFAALVIRQRLTR